MAYADNGLATAAGVKEFSVAWSIVGGRPASFNFFSYNSDAAGNVYNQQPLANSAGAIGTTARFERYFTITSSADGSSTLPFSRDCFVFNNNINEINIGGLNLYNFTMNSAGLSITRSSSGGDWNIAGSVICNAGLVDFGNSGTFGNTNVTSLQLLGGTISLDQTILPLAIAGNMTISGGNLTLSNAAGGDLNLGGNFLNRRSL